MGMSQKLTIGIRNLFSVSRNQMRSRQYFSLKPMLRMPFRASADLVKWMIVRESELIGDGNLAIAFHKGRAS